jgi:hypothetical protein
MKSKPTVIFAAAVTAALTICLHQGLGAFELFPRPEGQYTVKRGDSLYGIAGLYYSNPALWPFLWNQNPSVYFKKGAVDPQFQGLPVGSKINLYQNPFPFQAMSHSYLAPTGIPEEARFLISKTPHTGIPYDKKYFRFKLTKRPTRLWGYIVASPEMNKVHYLEKDMVYVSFRPSKKQCILVGDRFGIYRERGPLTHPVNKEKQVGILAEVVGELEIISTGNQLTTAIILESYVEIKKGDKICLFTPRKREIVPTKTHRMLTGTILKAAGRETFYSDVNSFENDIVFINRGECHGMKEGLLMNIYRPANPVSDPYNIGRRHPVPDKYIGEGMILKPFNKNSTMLITKSREEVLPGYIIKSVSD